MFRGMPLNAGKQVYPRAHWIFYNRYNFCFNPTGIRNLALPFGDEEFDHILAYSVFTHTSRAEMNNILKINKLCAFKSASGPSITSALIT